MSSPITINLLTGVHFPSYVTYQLTVNRILSIMRLFIFVWEDKQPMWLLMGREVLPISLSGLKSSDQSIALKFFLGVKGDTPCKERK